MKRYGFPISPGLGEGLFEETDGEWVRFDDSESRDAERIAVIADMEFAHGLRITELQSSIDGCALRVQNLAAKVADAEAEVDKWKRVAVWAVKNAFVSPHEHGVDRYVDWPGLEIFGFDEGGHVLAALATAEGEE